jgi:3D (Asp-Asp-Asp) domain-containing protein
MAYERIQTADRIKEMQKQYENSIMAYGYLSNYHTWTGVFRTTGYTLHPTECSKNKTHPFYGITATGTRATPFKTVAVDPAIVKLGSVLIDVVNGGVYLAEDTGNKVKGYTIDIFYGEGNEYNRKKSDEHGNEGVGQGMFLIVEPMKWKGLR